MQTQIESSTVPSFTLDPIHTSLAFSVRHLLITNVRGTFHRLSGKAHYDASRPEASRIDIEIETGSIDTHEPTRDAHLRSPEFFDAAAYPSIVFRSTRVRADRGRIVEIAGNLTLHGVTREVLLAVDEVTAEQKDHRGLRRIGASARATIQRSDFGITYNKVLEAGGLAIADAVTLTFDLSLVRD